MTSTIPSARRYSNFSSQFRKNIRSAVLNHNHLHPLLQMGKRYYSHIRRCFCSPTWRHSMWAREPAPRRKRTAVYQHSAAANWCLFIFHNLLFDFVWIINLYGLRCFGGWSKWEDARWGVIFLAPGETSSPPPSPVCVEGKAARWGKNARSKEIAHISKQQKYSLAVRERMPDPKGNHKLAMK